MVHGRSVDFAQAPVNALTISSPHRTRMDRRRCASAAVAAHSSVSTGPIVIAPVLAERGDVLHRDNSLPGPCHSSCQRLLSLRVGAGQRLRRRRRNAPIRPKSMQPWVRFNAFAVNAARCTAAILGSCHRDVQNLSPRPMELPVIKRRQGMQAPIAESVRH